MKEYFSTQQRNPMIYNMPTQNQTHPRYGIYNYDPEAGVYYREQKNWNGGLDTSMSHAISDYIFEPGLH